MEFDDLDTGAAPSGTAGFGGDAGAGAACTVVALPLDWPDGDPAEADPFGGEAPGSRPSHLSPSAAGLYSQCPRRWQFRYLDRLPDPPGEPALAGTFAHRVLELLLQEPPARRTVERARELARLTWPELEDHPDFAALGLDEAAARRFRWRAWRAIEGLWKLEDPCRVRVRATEQRVSTTVGTVPFRGVIDRLDHDTDGLAVTDYKSGRAPTQRFEAERLTQVLLYAAAVQEMLGERPTRVRLHYLGQRTLEAKVTDELLAEAVSGFEAVWTQLLSDCEQESFTPRPGPLCAWCPFADRCPEGQEQLRARDAWAQFTDPAEVTPLVATAG